MWYFRLFFFPPVLHGVCTYLVYYGFVGTFENYKTSFSLFYSMLRGKVYNRLVNGDECLETIMLKLYLVSEFE